MKIIKNVKKKKKSKASIQMTHGWPWQAYAIAHPRSLKTNIRGEKRS
jgi:hypothetical protein